ncbi:hypothetical protein [Gordonia sp. (in: high G+C Gram-positive bacteria)]|uniref:biotin synthase auxiliary protein BsaP n=1 Tax=Gordonia sp. (in: high G+C Gram-positive bacteria) TaxID=84139 RepID=UPI003C723086
MTSVIPGSSFPGAQSSGSQSSAPQSSGPQSSGPLQEPLRFGVYTGIEAELQSPEAVPAAAQLGLEPPRFCGQCGRRMVVQVRPDGWDARCSRHGTVDSSEVGQR